MVGWTCLTTLLNDHCFEAYLVAQKGAQIPLRRLDGPMRAKVLATMAGLIILGFGMVALVWLGGRFTRRYMKSGERPPNNQGFAEDWASRPIIRENRLLEADDDDSSA